MEAKYKQHTQLAQWLIPQVDHQTSHDLIVQVFNPTTSVFYPCHMCPQTLTKTQAYFSHPNTIQLMVPAVLQTVKLCLPTIALRISCISFCNSVRIVIKNQ